MNFDSNKAIYLQIADRICDEIVRGVYSDGMRLPSVRELAAQTEVNANTAMRSYEKLADKGIIYNRRGIGFFVAEGARVAIIKERGDELVEHKIGGFFNLLMSLGVTPDALRDSYQKYINENQINQDNETDN